MLPADSGQSLEQIEAILLQRIEQIQTQTISRQELEKARRKVISDRASELKTVSGLAASLGGSWFSAGDVHYGDHYLEKVSQVSAADLQRVAKKYLIPQNLNVVSLRPPTSTTKNSEPQRSPTQSSATLVQETLKNGVPLILKSDPKVPLVTVRALFQGGLLAEDQKNSGIGQLMARVLTKGTQSRSAEQIALEVENLGGSLECSSGNNSFTIAIEVLENDLPKAVELVADLALNPSFPEDEIAQEKKQQLTALKLQQDQPTAVAQLLLKEKLFGSHPYALNSLGSESSLSKLSRQDLLQFHRRLVNSSNLVLCVGGSFENTAAQSLLDKAFTKLPKGEVFQTQAQPDFQGRGTIFPSTTPKNQAIVMIGYPGVEVGSPDRAALEVVDEALSDLASRLFIRIREKQSLAYFVGTQQMIGRQPGMFLFYAGTAPGKAEKVRAEIQDEIRILVEQGLQKPELERARAKLLGQRLLQDQSAAAIAYKAGLGQLYGLGINYENQLLERIRNITSRKSTPSSAATSLNPTKSASSWNPNPPHHEASQNF
ncbi:MAG: insulinase family protein [Blastochloris sp.]|nr:insulinase family protein [Blastochloris sp.]